MSEVRKHFDEIAQKYDSYKIKNKFYYDNLKRLLSQFIPTRKNILEVGCGTGELLYFLKPKVGYGIDISSQMIKIAKTKYKNSKNLHFSTKKVSNFKNKIVEYILLSDVTEHLEEPGKMISDISKIMTGETKLIITMANPAWEPLLLIWEKLSLKMPEGKHKRLSYVDIKNLIEKSGLKIDSHDYYLLIPIKLPLITYLANRYLEKLFKKYAFIEYLVAKKV